MPIETSQSLQIKTLQKGIAHALGLIDENADASTVLSQAIRGILAKAVADADAVSKSFLPGKRVVTDASGRVIGAQG